MLILNPNKVANALRTNSLSETDKARLMLVGYAFGLISTFYSSASIRTWADLLLRIVYFSAILGGFWSCFRANESGDGRSFVERFVCLAVPLSILIWGGYIVTFYACFFMLQNRQGYDAASYTNTVRPYTLVAAFALVALYFTLLRRLILRVATTSQS